MRETFRDISRYWYLLRHDSDRPGHLAASFTVGGCIACIGAGLAVNGWPLGLWPETSVQPLAAYLGQIGVMVPIFELTMTMDLDHESRQISGKWYRRAWLIYWWLYKKAIPHRSDFSHSLLIGLPVRLVYASVLPLAIWLGYAWYAWSVFPLEMLQRLITPHGLITPHVSWLPPIPLIYLILSVWWAIVAALVNDLVHLVKDNYPRHYGFIGILFGKGASKRFKNWRRSCDRRRQRRHTR